MRLKLREKAGRRVSSSRQPPQDRRREDRRPDRPRPPRARKRTVAFWLGIALLVHGELALVLGIGFYFFAPRDADLQRKLAEQGPGESIDVGMVDEDAAREILAD